MHNIKTITALGVIVALIPLLGFPGSWESVFFILLGVTIAGLGTRIIFLEKSYEVTQGELFGSVEQAADTEDTDVPTTTSKDTSEKTAATSRTDNERV